QAQPDVGQQFAPAHCAAVPRTAAAAGKKNTSALRWPMPLCSRSDPNERRLFADAIIPVVQSNRSLESGAPVQVTPVHRLWLPGRLVFPSPRALARRDFEFHKRPYQFSDGAAAAN